MASMWADLGLVSRGACPGWYRKRAGNSGAIALRSGSVARRRGRPHGFRGSLGQADETRFTLGAAEFALDDGDGFRTNSGENPHGRLSVVWSVPVFINFAYKLRQTQDQRDAMLARLPKSVDTDFFEIEAKRGHPHQGPNAPDDAVSAGGTVPSCGAL